jgi:hypothetical protein
LASPTGKQRLRRETCGEAFTAPSGAPFLRPLEKEKLLARAERMGRGMTIRAAAAAVGLAADRAFRRRRRFLEFLAGRRPAGMTGVVEADETFFRKSCEGQRKGLPRPPKKRGGASKDAEGNGRAPVAVAMRRGTRAAAGRTLPDLVAASLTEALRPALGADAASSADGNGSHPVVAANLGIESGGLVAGRRGHGGCGVWHAQNADARDGRPEGWTGRFRGVAAKRLPRYLGRRRLLDLSRIPSQGGNSCFMR